MLLFFSPLFSSHLCCLDLPCLAPTKPNVRQRRAHCPKPHRIRQRQVIALLNLAAPHFLIDHLLIEQSHLYSILLLLLFAEFTCGTGCLCPYFLSVNAMTYLENTEVDLVRLVLDTLEVQSVLWSARGCACVAH